MRWLVSLICILMLTLIFAGSGHAEEVFRIGAPVSISGRYASFGTQAKNGIETAIEVWKKVRGDKVAGRNIEVLFRDTQSNNSLTVSVMNDLIQTQRSDVIIGPDGSDTAAASVPPWKKTENRPLWIMPGGSSDIIEKEIGADRYFFHTYAWSYLYHSNNMSELKRALGVNKTVALIYSDGAYGRAHVDHARKYITEGGFKIVLDELVREGAPDYNPVLVKVRAVHPDILYLLAQTNDAAQFAKQTRVAHLGVPYLIGTAQAQVPEWQNAVGDAQDCWTGVTTWVPGLNFQADLKEPLLFPSSNDWERGWREKYHATPEFLEVGYYASTMLALLAVEATHSTNRDALAGWLEKQNYQTPLGNSEFKPSQISPHQAFGTMVVFQRRKVGDQYKSILLYPPEVATGELKACE